MERVKTCSYLHPLALINCISVGDDDAAFLKCGTAVREEVFDDKILRNFGIYERCRENSRSRLNTLKITDTEVSQLCEDLVGGPGCDLIDHGPRERYQRRITDIRSEFRIY